MPFVEQVNHNYVLKSFPYFCYLLILRWMEQQPDCSALQKHIQADSGALWCQTQ